MAFARRIVLKPGMPIVLGFELGPAFRSFFAPVAPALVKRDHMNPAFAQAFFENSEAYGGSKIKSGCGQNSSDQPRALHIDVADKK